MFKRAIMPCIVVFSLIWIVAMMIIEIVNAYDRQEKVDAVIKAVIKLAVLIVVTVIVYL